MPLDSEGQNHIPEAVRRQGRRAEEIAREIGSVVDAPPVDEPAVELLPPAEEPAAEAPFVEEPVAEPANWEHRYRTLQGKYDAEVPAMRTRMNALERMLAEMQHPPARPEPHATTTTVVDIPKEEVEAYGEDLIAASQRWAAAKFQPEIDRLSRAFAELQNGQQRISASTTQERVIAEFDRTPPVPNWRQVNEDQKFIDWLNLVDPFSGEVRLTLLGNAFARGDAVRCAHFFKTFIAEHTAIDPASTPTPTHTPLEDAGRPTLESMAAPGRASGTVSQGGAPAEKRIWTSRDISAFYRDCADRKYDHREAEKLRIESDILAAPREGRIR